LHGRDDDGFVISLRARFDVHHRIFRDALMQDSNFVNAVHDAPHLRYRPPGKTAVLVKRLQPPLNIERLDVFRDFVSETRDEIGAHDLLDVADGVRRFRTHGIRPEIGLEIMPRKKIKMDAAGQRAVVNPDGQTEPVRLAPCVLIPRKFSDKSDWLDVLDPSAV
jgi:hypothetical protein